MKTIVFAAVCSSLLAVSTIQAAAAPRHQTKATRMSAQTTEQFRNARASVYAPNYDASSSRGNAGAAPASQ